MLNAMEETDGMRLADGDGSQGSVGNMYVGVSKLQRNLPSSESPSSAWPGLDGLDWTALIG